MNQLRELARMDETFVAGHDLCAGCGIPIILKNVLRGTRYPIVVANAPGCLEKASTAFPFTSWKVNWLFGTGGNVASTITGIETMYRSILKKGKYASDEKLKFLAIAGDGTTYDNGFGALSGAIERGHDFVYLCYDNQVNASTGGQRTSATMIGSATSTTPVGSILPGKMQFRKDITRVIASQKIPYAAQSAPWNWQDLNKKSSEAFEVQGPAFLNVLSPCPTVWDIAPHGSVEITKLATDTCIWPLYEIKHGHQVVINYKPEKKRSVMDWMESQGRFSHLLLLENRWIVDKIQEKVNRDWEWLLLMEDQTKGN
jgi:pyruvate ferredoxin oxidoreductase beta subunit